MRCFIRLLLLFLLAPPLAYSATYHVSKAGTNVSNCSLATNTGSASNALTTIRAGINCMSVGDTLTIHAGTYDETLDGLCGDVSWPRDVGSSWTAGQFFTVQGAPGDTVIMEPTSGTCSHIKLPGVDGDGHYVQYWFFKNMIFRDTARSYKGAVLINLSRGRFWRFDSVKVLGTLGNADINASGTEGILAGDEGFEIYNSEIGNHAVYGIYMTSFNGIIDGNYIHHCGGYCIHQFHNVFGKHNNIIRNNRIQYASQYHSDCWWAASGNGCPGSGMIISRGNDQQVYNNLITDTGNSVAGLEVFTDVQAAKIYNNTITDNIGGQCMWHGSGYDGIEIRNNLCYNNTGGNIIIANVGQPILTNNSTNSTNPQFQNPSGGDYRLTALSPTGTIRDAGGNLGSTWAMDIVNPFLTWATGHNRTTQGGTTWDLGAWELTAGGPSLTPEQGTFFMSPSGMNTSDCHAATGTGTPVTPPTVANHFPADWSYPSQCMLAGSTLYLRAGLYPPLDTNLTALPSGTSSQRTTVSAYQSDVVTLQATDVPLALRSGAGDDYLLFQKLILDAQGVGNGFSARGATNVRFEDGEIKTSHFELVYLEGTTAAEIRNSYLHGADFLAIVGLNGTEGTVLSGNRIESGVGGGIEMYPGSNGNAVIEKNTISLNTGGIKLAGDTGTKIWNNLIHSNGATTGIAVGVGVSGLTAYYNTLWNNTGACATFASGVTTSQFANNICWASPTVTNNASGGVTFTTNLCTGTGTGAGCTPSDPLFAGLSPGTPATFLHLGNTSPARDSGTPLAALTSDLLGHVRPYGGDGGVDIGAYEEPPAVTPAPALKINAPFRTTGLLLP